jgi:hypothetical protein
MIMMKLTLPIISAVVVDNEYEDDGNDVDEDDNKAV